LKKYGPEQEVGFPNTAYYLPIIYSMLGAKVEKLGDMKEIFQESRQLLPAQVSENLWLPYLAPALDAGMATFFAEEMFEAIRYLEEPNFYTKTEDPLADNIWLGAADDVIFRKRGVEFVTALPPVLPPSWARRPTPRWPARCPRVAGKEPLHLHA
jgi:acetyl-CoA synthase